MAIDSVDDELKVLIALANKYKYCGAEEQRTLQAGGVFVEPANFYSSLPTLNDIEQAFEYVEDAPFDNPRIFDRDVIRHNLSVLEQYSAEFAPEFEGNKENPERYYQNNGMFGHSDSFAYYAMIRHLKPNKIIEVGSGFSTLVACEAIARNGFGSITCVEPYPRPWLDSLPGVTVVEEPVQKLPREFFDDRLDDGDILFIDSTHTVKSGSDCLHLYLRVLPRLTRDVHVHVHDVFLPRGMPRKWAIEQHIHWTEQYLLLAYLLENSRCAMVFGSTYAQMTLPEELKDFMHERYAGGGGSFWFRQVAEGRRAIGWL